MGRVVPEFATPGPVSAIVTISDGRLTVTAGDRETTVVRVAARNGASSADVQAAHDTVVDVVSGRLTVTVPEPNWLRGIVGRAPAVHVEMELPTDSGLEARIVRADLHGVGRLGAVRVEAMSGNVHLDEVAALTVDSMSSSVTASSTTGALTINTMSGAVAIGRVGTTAIVRGVTGTIDVGEAAADINLSASSGDISVGVAHGDVIVRTSSGTVRLECMTGGEVKVLTASGDIQLGLADSVRAWIDAQTRTGTLHNSAGGRAAVLPAEPEAKRLAVRARTRSGDIMIHRAVPTTPPT